MFISKFKPYAFVALFIFSGCTKFSLKNSVLNCDGVRLELAENDMMLGKQYKLFAEKDNEFVISDAEDKTQKPKAFIFTKIDDTHVSVIKKNSGDKDDGKEVLCTYQKK